MNNTDLIWRNLSDFWGRIPSADREVIEKLWEGWMQCLDAEYNQLYNIDLGKALETCPVFTKYRWCLLDLSKKNLAKVSSYVKSIRSEELITNSKTSSINDALKVANHVDHRHFFIRPKNFKNTISLPFGLEPALVEGYVLKKGPNLSGADLYFGPDYLVNGSTISLGSTISPLDDVGFYVGINETNLEIGNRWNRYSEIADSKRNFILPDSYDTSIGVMVFVDGRFLHQDETIYDSANSITTTFDVSGLVEFIWYVKDESAVYNLFHEHKQQVFIYNPDAVSGTGTSGSTSYVVLSPSQSIPSDIRYTGVESGMRVFLRGYLYPPELYSYDPFTGKLEFNSPITWNANQFTPIVVEFDEIQNEEFESGHLHVIRQISNYQVSTISSTFDDGGRFDDGGFFDSQEDQNVLTLDFEVEDINSLRVYYNNRLLVYQNEYIISDDHKTLSFKFSIQGGNFRFEYERSAGRFFYGASDLDGLTSDQIRKANLLLFYNEDTELQAEFDVDSPYVDTKASEAYKLASQDIYCVSIPVIQNRVDNADIKYLEKTLTQKGFYKIVNGGIQSDGELPEFMWCPVVYFDESFLAKNFGVLVNYVKKDSSEAYKQALQAIWSGLWNGPVIDNIEWIVSMFLNVPFIPNDGVILSITKSLIYTEVVTESDKYYLKKDTLTTLKVGDNIYLGQSLESGVIYKDVTGFTSQGEYGATSLYVPNIHFYAKPGTIISVLNGNASGLYTVIRNEDDVVIVNKPLSGSIGLIQEDTFDDTVVYDIVDNSITWPQFSDSIESGSLIYIDAMYTSIKINNKIGKKIFLESTAVISSGMTFRIFNETSFVVVNKGSFPIAKRNGTVVSINRSYVSKIILDNGASVEVPSEFDLDVYQGQDVKKFQPVSRQISVYDHTVRKDWLFEENSAFNEELSSGGDDTTDRIIDSICNIDGFWITDTTQDFIGKVTRGDIFRVASGVNLPELTFKVELVKNTSLKLSNELESDSNVHYSIDRVTSHINAAKLPKRISVASPISSILASNITTSSPNIRIVDASGMPESGLIKIGYEFISYGYKSGNELRNCVRNYNKMGSYAFNAGEVIELISEFQTSVIREVFYAGVRSISDIIDNNLITEFSDELYGIIKNNTTVIELFANSSINQPDLANIDEFLRQVLPSSSFWFIDINKKVTDVDERPSTEIVNLSKINYNFEKLSSTANYTNIGSFVTVASTAEVGNYIFFSALNKYAYIINIVGNNLYLNSIVNPSDITTPIQIFSHTSTGTCGLNVITSDLPLDPGVQVGCKIIIVDGVNVGVYDVANVIGNEITIEGNFIENGNILKYKFYLTSNETSI